MEHNKIKKQHIRSTKKQIRLLMNYMATHKNFANSRNVSPFEARNKAKEWSALRALLRKHGPDKSVEKWKQTWKDIKKKVRKQTLEANKSVETFDEDQLQLEIETMSNELDTINEQEPFNNDVDFPEASDGHASKETKAKKCIRSTKNQIRLLMNYMATHKNFANSKNVSPLEARNKAKEWSALRALLRKHGPDRSIEKWKQTWKDIKKKVRKQTLEANKSVETFDEDQLHLEIETMSNELDTINEQESFNDDVDFPESSDGHAPQETKGKKFIRATNAQLKLLLNYMISNKVFASGSLYCPVEDAEGRQDKEWNNLRVLLREHGPDKSVRQWKTTWRDLKRKMRKLKIDAETLVETINVNTDKPFASEHMLKLDKTIKQEESSDEDMGIEHESSTDLDPLESTFNKYSMRNDVSIAIEKKSCSPMQVFVTNTDPPAYNTDPPVCANSSEPSLNCASSSNHCRCCHRNTLPPGSDHLQAQRNVLLQTLCNLLEEQNSILRMRNRIERNKIRYQCNRRL